MLSFTIRTSTASIATAGDITTSRWVKRRHYNPYSGQEIVQEFQIFFYKSLYCRAKTAAVVSPSTLNLANAVVGTSKTLASQLNTNSGELVTTANDASHCNYSTSCQIFDSSSQSWVALGSWTKGGITCDSTGAWTVNIPTTNTNYNPSTTLTMRVVYSITDSQVPVWQTPSRQVISQFNLTIESNCASSIVTHTNFADITYYVGVGSVATTYSPVFSGANNAVCP